MPKGVWFEEEYKRMYPYNSLACSLLGFANSDNSATIGIESSYNSFLQGTDGREYGYMDSDNNMETVIKDATRWRQYCFFGRYEHSAYCSEIYKEIYEKI